MATPSQRLHSFSLPRLKWATTIPRGTTHRTSNFLHQSLSSSVRATSPESKPAFSAPPLDRKPAEHDTGPKSVWRFCLQNTGATDGTPSATPPVTSMALAAPGTGCPKQAEKKTPQKKRPFSVSLTKEEIEEDLKKVADLIPKKRTKKRPIKVQKAMDSLFPGLYLGSITDKSYRIATAR